jgi:hypothetical protein
MTELFGRADMRNRFGVPARRVGSWEGGVVIDHYPDGVIIVWRRGSCACCCYDRVLAASHARSAQRAMRAWERDFRRTQEGGAR